MEHPQARIASLDVLRGVGILGILPVHIQSFSMVMAARVNPSVSGGLEGSNGWVWLATALLADGKFIAIFAMLFGAGLLLFGARAADRHTVVLHERRMFVLLGIGLGHAYLLWYGDMLATFALCGIVVSSCRALSTWKLIAVGALSIAVGSVISFGMAWSLPWWPDAAQARLFNAWAPSPEAISREVAFYRGGWLDQMAHRAPTAFQVETSQLILRGFWQTSGLMLIGMGLFKRGVLAAARPAREYGMMMALGFGVGLPVVSWGIARSVAVHWDLGDFMLVGTQLLYWGDLLVGVGWIGLVMILCRGGWRPAAVEAVGRTALSNYLLQTLICTTVFYGHGFGLFAHLDRVGQAVVVLCVWAIQLTCSAWWVNRFATGPVEWMWRSATRGALVPLR